MVKILVTGGTGLVGKTLKQYLPNAIYCNSRDGDLTYEGESYALIAKNKPDVVVHLAAKVAGMSSYQDNRIGHIEDNILMNTHILKASYLYGVKKFIAILSTCVYPDICSHYPMTEEDIHEGPPTSSFFEYAMSKRIMSSQIEAYNKYKGTNYNYLIPCNMYGQEDNFNGKAHFITDFMSKVYDAVTKHEEFVTILGTGNTLRQFMYAGDLASVIKYYIENDIKENVNVAYPYPMSINDIAKTILNVTGYKNIKIEHDLSKSDGQYRKDVSIEKLMKIMPDFKPTQLEIGVALTWASMITRKATEK